MSLFIVDVEADGPCPGLYSMISIGCVKFGKHNDSNHGFHANICPISNHYVPEALTVSGFSREDCMEFTPASYAMDDFYLWLKQENNGRMTFVSDNPAFDWQFVNYYFWKYYGKNPFGHSARRIGDFAAGLMEDFYARQDWKKLRRTTHTHNPLDDARGNAEALETLINRNTNANT
jgi:hypothetical protein